MNVKLTLSLDRDIIDQAKEFARSRQTSLSRLIEDYLRQAVTPDNEVKQVTPLVARLSGVIDSRKLGDSKNDYADYLEDKYR
jgi:hypothetical protein